LGGVSSTPPVPPNLQVELGRLVIKDTVNGKVFIHVESQYRLNDITDVNIISPSVDQIVKWNGLEWINANIGTVSASNGVNFYYSTPVFNSRTEPVGLNQNGTDGNGVQVMSLSKEPVTSGGTKYIQAYVSGDTRATVAWLYNNSIGRNIIDSGIWEFKTWYCSDTAVDSITVADSIYQ